jgi:hypothetical protein
MLFNQNFDLLLPFISTDLNFLSQTYPTISFVCHNISMPYLVNQSHVEYPLNETRGHLAARLFIPLLYHADWFLYIDDDIEAVDYFFPEILSFASDRSKILFAVRDHTIMLSRRDCRYIRRVSPTFDVERYVNCGLLLMRGGEVLKEQFRNIIMCLSHHRHLKYHDQDAINFAINPGLVGLLPWPFCVGRDLHSQMGNRSILKHYNGFRKSSTRDIGGKLSAIYREAKQISRNAESKTSGVWLLDRCA